jgi:hypothetical protein
MRARSAHSRAHLPELTTQVPRRARQKKTNRFSVQNGVRNLLTHEFFGFEGQQKIKNGDF